MGVRKAKRYVRGLMYFPRTEGSVSWKRVVVIVEVRGSVHFGIKLEC